MLVVAAEAEVAAAAEVPVVAVVAREVFAVEGGSHHTVEPVIVEKGQSVKRLIFPPAVSEGHDQEK